MLCCAVPYGCATTPPTAASNKLKVLMSMQRTLVCLKCDLSIHGQSALASAQLDVSALDAITNQATAHSHAQV